MGGVGRRGDHVVDHVIDHLLGATYGERLAVWRVTDLSSVPGIFAGIARERIRAGRGMVEALWGSEKPVVAAVDGFAFGAADFVGSNNWVISGEYTASGLPLLANDPHAGMGLDLPAALRRGVCIGFVERVPKVIGFRPHSALWVSVADCDGL